MRHYKFGKVEKGCKKSKLSKFHHMKINTLFTRQQYLSDFKTSLVPDQLVT